MAKNIVIGDTQYEADMAYHEGVLAFQSGTPWSCNPYRSGSRKNEQWDYGHVNESEFPRHLEIAHKRDNGLWYFSERDDIA